MDPMRALASLEFVSARGLETSDTGPKILANHVKLNIFVYFWYPSLSWQFGMKMMKLERKRSELLTELEKRRRARLPLDGVKGEFVKVTNLFDNRTTQYIDD